MANCARTESHLPSPVGTADLGHPGDRPDTPRVTPAGPKTGRLPCTLSLDLDDAWTYLRAAGRAGWETAPTLVPVVCGRLLALLEHWRVRATLFVITRDLEDPVKIEAIRPFVAAGHEIGCHSHWHHPHFATLSRAEVEHEILGAADRIESVLGVRPRGFRAPGFAQNPHTIDVLREGGFQYDASLLATFLGPIARTWYFLHSGMNAEERRRRSAMFGRLADALRSQRPHMLDDAPQLASVPVTVVPLLRTPFHTSYLLWLEGISPALARSYLALGLGLCRLTSLPPSYLLHSLDFIGRDEVQGLGFFPGMELDWDRKHRVLDHVLSRLTTNFDVGPLADRAAQLAREVLPAS